MEGSTHASVPLRVGKKMRKRRELDALVGGGGGRSSRLLSASSDEGEPWPWGRRMRRRRTRPFLRLAALLALCVCVVSAATVLWLFVDVRRQIVSLRVEIDRVSTSSEGVDDALQLCHTAAKELRANASQLSARLDELERAHKELALKVSSAAGELAVVTEQLAAAPLLADTPHRLATLQQTVANFGSQINGFDGTLQSVHKQAAAAASGLEELRASLQFLESRINDTAAITTSVAHRDDALQDQLNVLNSTLSERLDALKNKFEATLTTSTVAPTTSTTSTSIAPTTSSSTTTSTTTSTTKPTTQGTPPKPSVTQ